MRDGGKSGGKARQKPAKFSVVPKAAEKSATEICQANKKKGLGLGKCAENLCSSRRRKKTRARARGNP